jgi:hypothetical protein
MVDKEQDMISVPHSGSGVAPMSSLSGVELLGFWGTWNGSGDWVKGGASGVSLQET